MEKIYIKSFLLLGAFCFAINLQAQDVQYHTKVTTDDPSVDWEMDGILATFGPRTPGNVTATAAWATDGVTEPTDADSTSQIGQYCCEAIANPDDLAGNLAFISRGSCEFGVKLLNVETAGAVAGIIGNRAPIGRDIGTHTAGLVWMGAGEVGDSVTIPGQFISYEDRRVLGNILDAGPSTITFVQEYIVDAAGPYAKTTPVEQIIPLEDFSMVVMNLDTVDWINVTFNCEITSPSAAVTVLSEVVDTIFTAVNLGIQAGATVSGEYLIEFEEAYMPTETGEFTAVYTVDVGDPSHPISSESKTLTWSVTEDKMWALDNGNVVHTSGMPMEFQAYIDNGGQYGTGSIYRTGTEAALAAGVTFGLANPQDLFPGDQIIAKVIRADGDGDGSLDNDQSTIVDLFDFPPSQVLTAGAYEITGNEGANDMLTVTFDVPAELAGGGLYLVTVEAPGFAVNGSPFPPAWTTAGGMNYPNYGTIYRFGNDSEGTFEVDGWERWNNTTGLPSFPHGGPHTVVRLLTEVEAVATEDLLSTSQFKVYPTLTNNQVQLDLSLENFSEVVKIKIADISGKLMTSTIERNVTQATFTFDVSEYAAGTYFMTFETREGSNTSKFVVAK